MMKINSLDEFTQAFHQFLEQKPELPKLEQEGLKILQALLRVPNLLNDTLTRLVLDEPFLKSQWLSIDANEIVLYRSPDKSFSVRVYIWEPQVTYPIHDHGAWGLVGGYINQFRERKYARVDDGQTENRAEIKLIAEGEFNPGETTIVRPLNEGIHQMGATGDQAAVTVHVYGTPIRKGYIQNYNPHNQGVHRVYAPQLYKQALAIRALGSIPDAWAEEVLRDAARQLPAAFMQMESRLALAKK